jgi:hypothetical protein
MRKRDIFFILFFISVFLFILLPHASEWPDGLERVAQDKGFLHKTENAGFSLGSGLFGMLLLFLLGVGMGLLLKNKRP